MSGMKKIKLFMSILKERDWLEEMAEKGYILKNIKLGSIYYFDEIEPKSVVYEIEKFAVNSSGEAGKHELTARKTALDIAKQSGWEVVTHDELMNYYFVKEKAGDESDEFYNDYEDRKYKADKISRSIKSEQPKMLLTLLMIIAVIYILLFIVIGNDLHSLVLFMGIFIAVTIIEVGAALYNMIAGEKIYQELLLSREQWEMQKKHSVKKNFKKVKDLIDYLQSENDKGVVLTETINGKFIFEESDKKYVYYADTKKALKNRLKKQGEKLVDEKKDWENLSTGWYERSIVDAESKGLEVVCAIEGGTIIYKTEADNDKDVWDTEAVRTGNGDMIASLRNWLCAAFGLAFVMGFVAGMIL